MIQSSAVLAGDVLTMWKCAVNGVKDGRPCCEGATEMRKWKMRYGQKCKGGKCRSRQAVWKAEPILFIWKTLGLLPIIFLRLLSEYRVILVHYYKIVAAFVLYSGSLL